MCDGYGRSRPAIGYGSPRSNVNGTPTRGTLDLKSDATVLGFLALLVSMHVNGSNEIKAKCFCEQGGSTWNS